MKRDERKVSLFEKFLRTHKSARSISSKCFENIFFGRIFLNFSFECSESYRVFDYLHDSSSIFRATGID